MPPYVVEAIAPLIALLGVGSFVLIGMKMRLDAKVRMHAGKSEDMDRLVDAVDAVHEELRMLRGDVTELQDRVDFTERLLTRGQAGESVNHGA